MESIREKIKNDILGRAKQAQLQAEIIRTKENITRDQVYDCLNRYVCYKFFLEPEENTGLSLHELAGLSIDRALELKLPLAKESERATTCGMSGDGTMKIAMLLNTLKKDLELDINPYKLGLVGDIDELTELVFSAIK